MIDLFNPVILFQRAPRTKAARIYLYSCVFLHSQKFHDHETSLTISIINMNPNMKIFLYLISKHSVKAQ